MILLMERLIGRLPIGWLQLTHNKTRMIAALAGVAFANILVFVQLGIFGALEKTIDTSYRYFDADILISAGNSNSLSDGSNLSRRYMYQALGVPGVPAAAPLYIGIINWLRPDGISTSLRIYGVPPEAEAFMAPNMQDLLSGLKVQDTVLIDDQTRGFKAGAFDGVSRDNPMYFELNGKEMRAIGSYSSGGGFSADGSMIVSDQTFLRLFGKRLAGTPSHLMLKVAADHNVQTVVEELQWRLTGEPVLVRNYEEAIQQDISYQITKRPVGVVFGFGVFIGILVGIVIVYQVLSTDVAEHLREYATFKAMGYKQRFFLGIIFEEAFLLALLGFIPGVTLAIIIYVAISHATGLPVEMNAGRATAVLLGTMAACAFSGFIATRRLAAADPAELF